MSRPLMVFASFHPRDGHADAVRDILLDMRTATRNEPGCQQYDVLVAEQDGSTAYHIVEKYTDDNALQAHRDSEHYKAYRAAIPELLVGPIGVVVSYEVS